MLPLRIWQVASWAFSIVESNPFEVLWEEAVTKPNGRDHVALLLEEESFGSRCGGVPWRVGVWKVRSFCKCFEGEFLKVLVDHSF